MILGLGIPELLIILVVVLLIFGPKNLPKLGKSLGKTVKGIREGMDEVQEDGEPKPAEAAGVEVKPSSEDGDVEDAEDASASDGSKFCPECGAKNPSDNHFCSKCGHKLD